MMFLKNESPSLIAELAKRLDPDSRPEEGLSPADIHITDFDETRYRVEVPVENTNIVRVSMFMPCYKDLLSSDVEGHLRSIYGSLVSAPHEGADVTLVLTLDALPAGKSVSELATQVAQLRWHALSSAFDKAFKSVASKGASPAAEVVIRLRPREPVFVLPRADRVAVIYALHFADATDRAVARIICQEFVEAQRHISTAPPVNYSDREPPLELRGRADLLRHAEESFVGYLTFSMMPRQFDSDAKRANVTALLTQFRSYLDYHIKAAKGYLHGRMRARVDGWMQVLNRAVAEDPFASKEKKLASGKTFVKKV